jgi:hypothetical protein
MRRYVAAAVIIVLLLIDFLEFHDVFEPKTLPEILTGLISLPIFVLMARDLVKGAR